MIKLDTVDLQFHLEPDSTSTGSFCEICEICKNSYLQNTTKRPLLIIAVSNVGKGELTNETINFDIEIKTCQLSQRSKLSKRPVQTKEQV